jgi:hypothetical protein
MKQWHRKGERLILCLDATKNIYRGELGRELTDLHGLGIKDVVGEFTARKLGATYFQGSVPIDAIWATSDVTVANACVMPVGYGIGDHCLFCCGFCNNIASRYQLHAKDYPTCSSSIKHKNRGMCSTV